MLLTIDAGNTRTKWAIFNRNGDIIHSGVCVNDELSSMDFGSQSPAFERAIISNVAGNAHASRLEQLLTNHNMPVTWVKADRESCHVINGYTEVETLGTDRWASLIAAWHSKQAPCVVVNAGTAVTIDALCIHSANHQYGEFLGGMIVPGISLMLTSLGVNTAQLPLLHPLHVLDAGASLDIFATSTTQAMNSGAINAVGGAIAQMSKAMEIKCAQIPYIILSGGDASVIQSCLEDTLLKRTLVMDHLVLKGLYLIACSKP